MFAQKKQCSGDYCSVGGERLKENLFQLTSGTTEVNDEISMVRKTKMVTTIMLMIMMSRTSRDAVTLRHLKIVIFCYVAGRAGFA